MVSAHGYQSGAKKYAEDNGLLAITPNELPNVGELIAICLERILLPDEDSVGEPFWSLYAAQNNQVTGDVHAEYINGWYGAFLFFPKKSAQTFLESRCFSNTKYVVRGLSQNFLKGFISVCDAYKANYFLVFDVQPNRVGLVPLPRQQLIDEYVLDGATIPKEPMVLPSVQEVADTKRTDENSKTGGEDGLDRAAALTDRVQALNYCAHAIEDLQETEKEFRDKAPGCAHVLRGVMKMLQESLKFVLPNCCDLLDSDELQQEHLNLVRLPFPCVAFEAPWEKNDHIEPVGGFDQTPATKRIALCWEPSPRYELVPGMNSELSRFGEGVVVLPIYWGPALKSWTVAFGGGFFPYDNTVQPVVMENLLPASRIAYEAITKAGLARAEANQFKFEPLCFMPEMYEPMLAACDGKDEDLFAQIIIDSRDEVLTLIKACIVTNCANVTTTEIHPPDALNKRRQKEGKQPFFSYNVLQTDERREKAEAEEHHAIPRMHLGRGHLRRLENRVIWVRPTLVGR